MIELIEDIRAFSKDCWIINYSNPAAIVAEAVKRVFPDDKKIIEQKRNQYPEMLPPWKWCNQIPHLRSIRQIKPFQILLQFAAVPTRKFPTGTDVSDRRPAGPAACHTVFGAFPR